MQRIVDTETSSMHEYTRETITRHSSKSCNHLNYPQTSLTISCKQIHLNTVLPTQSCIWRANSSFALYLEEELFFQFPFHARVGNTESL